MKRALTVIYVAFAVALGVAYSWVWTVVVLAGFGFSLLSAATLGAVGRGATTWSRRLYGRDWR